MKEGGVNTSADDDIAIVLTVRRATYEYSDWFALVELCQRFASSDNRFYFHTN